MSVLEMITRIHSSMIDPGSDSDDSGHGSVHLADWNDEVMNRLISLFSNPEPPARAPDNAESALSSEPEYFRHLMAYLRQRNAEEEQLASSQPPQDVEIE